MYVRYHIIMYVRMYLHVYMFYKYGVRSICLCSKDTTAVAGNGNVSLTPTGFPRAAPGGVFFLPLTHTPCIPSVAPAPQPPPPLPPTLSLELSSVGGCNHVLLLLRWCGTSTLMLIGVGSIATGGGGGGSACATNNSPLSRKRQRLS